MGNENSNNRNTNENSNENIGNRNTSNSNNYNSNNNNREMKSEQGEERQDNTENNELRSVLLLRILVEKLVGYNHWQQRRDSRLQGEYKWNPNDLPPEPLLSQKYDEEQINNGIILEMAFILSGRRIRKTVHSLAKECKTYLQSSHKTNYNRWWGKQIDDENRKHKPVMRVMLTWLLIANKTKQHNQFKIDPPTVVDRLYEVVKTVFADEGDKNKSIHFRQLINKARHHFNLKFTVPTNCATNEVKAKAIATNNESMINTLIRYRIVNLLEKHQNDYKEKYEQLKAVVDSYNKKISSRTGRKGAYTLEYGLALRQIHSQASITEQQLPNHIELCFCLLPQSTHDNDIIPVVPCQNTIATMIDTLNLNHIDDVIQNGNKYSFGISTDAATMPSKIAKKMMPFFIYSKYNSSHNEDYKLGTYVGPMQPPDKRTENGETTAKAIAEQCKKIPSKDSSGNDIIVVFSTYFSDTASTEQLSCELLRTGKVVVPNHIFTRLMGFLGDGPHMCHTTCQQGLAVITGKKYDRANGQDVDYTSYICKALRKLVPGIPEIHSLALQFYGTNESTVFTAMSQTRFAGINSAGNELFYTSWRLKDDNNGGGGIVDAAIDEQLKRDARRKRRRERARENRANARRDRTSTASEPAIANTATQKQKRQLGKHARKNDSTVGTVNDEDEVEEETVVTGNNNENKSVSVAPNEDADAKESTVDDDWRDALSDSESRAVSVFELSDSEECASSDSMDENEIYSHNMETVARVRHKYNYNNNNKEDSDNNNNNNDDESENKNNDNDDESDNKNNNNDNESDYDSDLELDMSDVKATPFEPVIAKRLFDNLETFMVHKDEIQEKTEEKVDSSVVEDKYPITLRKGKYEREYDFKKIRIIVWACREYLQETKKVSSYIKRIINDVIWFFSDISRLSTLYVGYLTSEIGVIPLLNFFKSNDGSGRAIEMFTKIFDCVKRMESVRQAVLRKKIETMTKEQIETAMRIINDKFDTTFLDKSEFCYLNVQQKTGGLSTCENISTTDFPQCVNHAPDIPPNSNLKYMSKKLAPGLNKFEKDLFLWNNLFPTMLEKTDVDEDNNLIDKWYHAWIEFQNDDEFDNYIESDGTVNKETANLVFWVYAYISLVWMIYKMVQKFNTMCIPDIAVPCLLCDPSKGHTYAKILVKIGKDKLIDLSWKRLNFDSKKEFEAYLNKLLATDKTTLHKTNMFWFDPKIWGLIEAFANDEHAPQCLKHWEHDTIVASEFDIGNEQNQLWMLCYSKAEVMGTSLDVESFQKIYKQMKNCYYFHLDAFSRLTFWSFNSKKSLKLGGYTYCDLKKRGVNPADQQLRTIEAKDNWTNNFFAIDSNKERFHNNHRLVKKNKKENANETILTKNDTVCQKKQLPQSMNRDILAYKEKNPDNSNINDDSDENSGGFSEREESNKENDENCLNEIAKLEQAAKEKKRKRKNRKRGLSKLIKEKQKQKDGPPSKSRYGFREKTKAQCKNDSSSSSGSDDTSSDGETTSSEHGSSVDDPDYILRKDKHVRKSRIIRLPQLHDDINEDKMEANKYPMRELNLWGVDLKLQNERIKKKDGTYKKWNKFNKTEKGRTILRKCFDLQNESTQ